jgi:hypothetical protein
VIAVFLLSNAFIVFSAVTIARLAAKGEVQERDEPEFLFLVLVVVAAAVAMGWWANELFGGAK